MMPDAQAASRHTSETPPNGCAGAPTGDCAPAGKIVAASPNDLGPKGGTSDNFVLCLKNLLGSGEGPVIGHVRCDVTVRNQGLDEAELTFSSLALIRISAQPTAND